MSKPIIIGTPVKKYIIILLRTKSITPLTYIVKSSDGITYTHTTDENKALRLNEEQAMSILTSLNSIKIMYGVIIHSKFLKKK